MSTMRECCECGTEVEDDIDRDMNAQYCGPNGTCLTFPRLYNDGQEPTS